MRVDGVIKDVPTLVSAVTEANTRFGGQVWWRGQRNVSWGLSPSVARPPHNGRSEQSLCARFRQKAPSRHPRVPNYEDLPGWLFLMQHYRLPTRLLDWTESPLVACYFASEIDQAASDHPEEVEDEDGALFALSPYSLNESHLRRRVLLLPADSPAPLLIRRAFDSSTADIHAVVAIRPSEVDPRLMVQLSVFTLHGQAVALESLTGHEGFILKYSVPTKHKQHVRKQLKQLGIRESSIFPDLEHLARDISSVGFKDTGPTAPVDLPVIPEGPTFDFPSEGWAGEASS